MKSLWWPLTAAVVVITVGALIGEAGTAVGLAGVGFGVVAFQEFQRRESAGVIAFALGMAVIMIAISAGFIMTGSEV